MFNFKTSCTCIFLIYCVLKIVAVGAEGDKIIIEGGERELKKLFKDFYEMKDAINDLKSSFEELREIIDSKREVPMFDNRFDTLPEKCGNYAPPPKDCAAATASTQRSGIYKIQNEQFSSKPFLVECDSYTENDWLVIQRRQDGSVDFYRNWEEYENGFGDIKGEFFIGLKKLYALTNFNGPQELLIVMKDSNRTSVYAKYDSFVIGNATELYALKEIGKYSGTAGDSLKRHIGMKFTTKDRDNDIENKRNCAVAFRGAWWYEACHDSNLNGKYDDNSFGNGINWETFRGSYISLKYVKMMIRRRRT